MFKAQNKANGSKTYCNNHLHTFPYTDMHCNWIQFGSPYYYANINKLQISST